MFNALSTAATGLEAQQSKISNVANDLANLSTDGYKKTTTEFQELMYSHLREPSGAPAGQPVGVETGMGVRVGASYKNFEQGPAKITNQPYDLMIDGPGFFQLQTQSGEIVYSRRGAFHIDSQGVMQLAGGAKLEPPIIVPPNALGFNINRKGDVIASLPGGAESVLGQIQLVGFQNAQGLVATGDGHYKLSASSGAPILAVPGENGLGFIHQGALEASNVNVAASMVDMIESQRSYEAMAKLMATADQMLAAAVKI